MIDQFKKRVILQRPDFHEPFILQTDASGLATGAVLKQKITGQEKIISVNMCNGLANAKRLLAHIPSKTIG